MGVSSSTDAETNSFRTAKDAGHDHCHHETEHSSADTSPWPSERGVSDHCEVERGLSKQTVNYPLACNAILRLNSSTPTTAPTTSSTISDANSLTRVGSANQVTIQKESECEGLKPSYIPTAAPIFPSFVGAEAGRNVCISAHHHHANNGFCEQERLLTPVLCDVLVPKKTTIGNELSSCVIQTATSAFTAATHSDFSPNAEEVCSVQEVGTSITRDSSSPLTGDDDSDSNCQDSYPRNAHHYREQHQCYRSNGASIEKVVLGRAEVTKQDSRFPLREWKSHLSFEQDVVSGTSRMSTDAEIAAQRRQIIKDVLSQQRSGSKLGTQRRLSRLHCDSNHSQSSSLSSMDCPERDRQHGGLKIQHASRHESGTWTSPHMMYPSRTKPVACPRSNSNREEHRSAASIAETSRLYDSATWRMYNRITSARRSRTTQSGANAAASVSFPNASSADLACFQGTLQQALDVGHDAAQHHEHSLDVTDGVGGVFSLDMDA